MVIAIQLIYTTELSTLKGWTIWYLNYLLRLLKRERNINSTPSFQGTFNLAVERKKKDTQIRQASIDFYKAKENCLLQKIKTLKFRRRLQRQNDLIFFFLSNPSDL